MLAILVRILSTVFLVWIVRRLLSMFAKGSRTNQPGEESAENPNQMVKDPVCGMYMDSRLAVRLERRQEKYFFCSEDCKERYLNQSTGAQDAPPPG
jgi:uncharacterized protein